jgi:alkyl hydroperoxide reductase subunit AhpC
MRKFKANVYLARKASEVCPSKWREEGDPTLTPSPDMVGKVHEALRGR